MEDSFFSLLHLRKCEKYETLPPSFFGDLQLEGICSAILSKYMDFDLKQYYYTMPDCIQTVRYRQDIYRDLERNPQMILSLKKYINSLSACERSYALFQQVDDEVKRGSYLLLAYRNYVSSLERLRETLLEADLSSGGLKQCRKLLEERFQNFEFTKFCDTVSESFASMEQLRLTLLVRDKEISVVEEEKPVPEEMHPRTDGEMASQSVVEQLKGYIRALDVPVDDEWESLSESVTNLFPAPLETGPLENTIVEILKKSRPGVFDMLRKFSSYDFSPYEDLFVQLKNEVAFYLSFYEFERQMNAFGYEFGHPNVTEGGGMELVGVYDIALAWKNRFTGDVVVPNDISYGKGKSFLVVTGPNQGGKTTLARAVGQSVYFMLLGLKAPCRSMSARFFERILTHFEVEESVETGAGKLKEELIRLKPMMTFSAQGCFVILNELFTTATTYDAEIMAKKVMGHFIENGCLGIYVTHIQELANEETQPGVQSMVAQLDGEDPSARTFIILPQRAEGLGRSDAIVRKYRLDFESVTERIAGL